MTINEIARVCHEANKALCKTQNDFSQVEWDSAPEELRRSATGGVEFHLANPDATPENSHENWLKQKEADGYVYGEVKDLEKKTHPCFRPYAELPDDQKAKDYLFRGIVHSLAKFIEE